MNKLPSINADRALKVFGKLGYRVDHQTGSHIILRNEAPPFRRLTVPNHKSIAKGTLRSLIREAGITIEEFIDLMIDQP